MKRSTLKLMWEKHRLLVIGFAAAVIITVFFVSKMLLGIVYWSTHRDEELAGWMTIGYVSHSYEVRREVLGKALDLPRGGPKRLTLVDIAEMQSVELSVIKSQILAAIEAERTSK